MPLEKKATDKLKHVAASSIMTATVVEQYQHPLVTYMAGHGAQCSEVTAFCTPQAFAGFKNGYGHRHPHLRNGLVKSHRYEFQILLDDNGMVVGAHAIPNDNFVMSDMAGEIPGRNFAPENAVCNIKADTGEIAIHVFPSSLSRHMTSLVKELEAKEKITEGDVFKVGSVDYEVQQINGGEVVFDCRDHRDHDAIGRSGLGR